jgi:hypothetical protein
MKKNNEQFPEPPELRLQGVPPLIKELRFILIAFGVAFIIALIFMLIFKFKNG